MPEVFGSAHSYIFFLFGSDVTEVSGSSNKKYYSSLILCQNKLECFLQLIIERVFSVIQIATFIRSYKTRVIFLHGANALAYCVDVAVTKKEKVLTEE
jgi:hypothetical protein